MENLLALTGTSIGTPQRPLFLLFPGLGADGRLGYAQRALPYDVVSLDYIDTLDGESLGSYSRRFLDELVRNGTISYSREIVLAGISMGGAIAQEMSRHLPAKALILIGSLRSGHELRRALRLYGEYLSVHAPLWLYEAGVRAIEPMMGKVSGLSQQDIELCREMYDDLPKHLFREGLRMLAEWHGCVTNLPTLRIHGEADHIIPLEHTANVDIVIPDGRHLVSVSHAELVNDAINKFLRGTSF